MMELRPGLRLRSAVSAAEVVLVRVPDGEVDLRCGGVPVRRMEDEAGGLEPTAHADVVLQVGKRYTNQSGSLEALCTKSGPGGLALDGELLAVRAAKALPASD